MIPYNSDFGLHDTNTFQEIYEDLDAFIVDFDLYSGVGLQPDFKSETTINTIYYLLMGRFCNDCIRNYDVNQFKLKLFSYIYQYGPSFEKNTQIQKDLRAMSYDDLMVGAITINNHAYNPSTDVNTVDGEITTINEQTKSKYKTSKLSAISTLVTLLKNDVTNEFLTRFNNLFSQFPSGQYARYYDNEVE